MLTILLYALLYTVSAQEVVLAVSSDGSVLLTNLPQPKNVQIIDLYAPPPKKSEATIKNFPQMDLYDDTILLVAQTEMIDAALIKAVIMAESRMNPNAQSHAGAQGLMQLMPSTAANLGVTDSFDPEQNIRGGSNYLRKNIDKFGSIELALAAYNAGPQNVIKHKGIPPFEETQIYVERVMDLYQYFLVERPIVSSNAKF